MVYAKNKAAIHYKNNNNKLSLYDFKNDFVNNIKLRRGKYNNFSYNIKVDSMLACLNLTYVDLENARRKKEDDENDDSMEEAIMNLVKS